MYEDQTYEAVLERCLENSRDDIDKTEGGVFFTALAPACLEFAIHYTELDGIVRDTYADTCDRDHLILRCKERGIFPYPATAAVLKGEFNVDIGVGKRFSLDELNYISTEYIGRSEGESGSYLYKMQCEQVGTDGNKHFGSLSAIEYITNLETAELTELLIPAEDEEDTELLRARYFSSFETDPFGGNKKDYKEKTNKLDGVGDTKVIPTWNGGGTVKLIIIDSLFSKASDTLIKSVQEAIDPLSDQGNGSGIAPVGHTVTVVTVREREVKVKTHIEYKKKDYKEKTNKLDGVGDTKVIPTWNGGGTVKLIIIDSLFSKASDTLIKSVQEAIDPLSDQGNGSGIAPVGHTVTVVTVREREVKVKTHIEYKEGFSWSRIGSEINKTIEEYLLEMRKDWANQSHLSVRITQIEARLLKLEGIVDISETTINGSTDNLVLEPDEIPVLYSGGVEVI